MLRKNGIVGTGAAGVQRHCGGEDSGVAAAEAADG